MSKIGTCRFREVCPFFGWWWGVKTMGALVNRKHSSSPLDLLLVMCLQRHAEKTRMALFLHASRPPRLRHSLWHHYRRHGIPLQKHYAVFRITTAGTTCRSIQALSTLPFGGLFGSLLSSSAQFGKTLRAEWTELIKVNGFRLKTENGQRNETATHSVDITLDVFRVTARYYGWHCHQTRHKFTSFWHRDQSIFMVRVGRG